MSAAESKYPLGPVSSGARYSLDYVRSGIKTHLTLLNLPSEGKMLAHLPMSTVVINYSTNLKYSPDHLSSRAKIFI